MHCAVVGAGIIGLTTAVRLRAAGHTATLIAPELPALPGPSAPGEGPDAAAAFRVDGATHAAAGMLAPLTETQHSQDALAPLLAAGGARWPELLDLVARWSGAPTGHDARGSLAVGADRADVEQWAHVLARAERHGRRAERLTGTALRRAAPALAPGLAGGFAAPDDHSLDPRRTVRACLAALLAPTEGRTAGGAADGAGGAAPFLDGGPAILVRGRALDVVQDGAGVRVAVAVERATQERAGGARAGAAREVRADVVVLAAGLGHGRIQGDPAAQPVPLRPVHGDILRLRVPPRLLAPGEEHLVPGPVRALVHGRSVYFVPRADGELVVGASAREDALAQTSAGAVLDLLADAAAVLPAVRECALAEVHTAARPGTPDDVPHVGALAAAPRAVVATGAHRHGILLAPWMSAAALGLAERAAGLPVTDPEVLALTDATRLDRFSATSDLDPIIDREDTPCPS